MLTDIEIASQASMLPITEVAAGLGVCADELEPSPGSSAKDDNVFPMVPAGKPLEDMILDAAGGKTK